jgi:chromosome partitioning protein
MRRKAFANATGLGLAVSEMAPRDPKACEEIERLVGNLFSVSDLVQGKSEATV